MTRRLAHACIALGSLLVVAGLYVTAHPSLTTSRTDLEDCGPQALAGLLADHYHMTPSADAIATLAGTTSAGTTMLGLKRAAAALGIQADGMRLTMSELTGYVERGHGAIVFVNGDHYVWVKRLHPDGVVIKDTGPGFQFVPHATWARMWLDDRAAPGDPDGARGVSLILEPLAS